MGVQTILVPLDGSSRAEQAIPIAARIARACDSTLVLVRVRSLATEAWPAMMTTNPLVAEAMVETSMKEAAAYLERVAASPELDGLSLQLKTPHGPVASTLLEIAASSCSDLIVLCRHGATDLSRWALGSVASAIVWHTSVPVLVLSEGYTHPGRSPADLVQPLRMLIPLDGSATANTALDPGSQMLAALAGPGQKTALHLACVVKPARTLGRELPMAKAFLRQTTERIQRGVLASAVPLQSIAVTWSVLLDTDVAGALLRVAEQGEDTEGSGAFGGCHLIAMATHGRGGVLRRMMGSVTERVLSATHRPILLIHPRGTSRTGHQRAGNGLERAELPRCRSHVCSLRERSVRRCSSYEHTDVSSRKAGPYHEARSVFRDVWNDPVRLCFWR